MTSAVRSLIFVVAVTAFIVSKPATTWAQFEVAPGFNLWTTDPGGTHFFFFGTPLQGPPIPFQGVPIGTFDFGGNVGVRGVGTTDTIVQRLDPAIGGPGETKTVDIELVALQLRSVNPINVGGQSDFYYITLNQSQPNLAIMDVTFDDATGGTYGLAIQDLGVDVHKGAIDGPIEFSDARFVFTESDIPWGRNPAQTALQIDGVNKNLKGDMTSAGDIWSASGLAVLNATSGTKGPGQLSLMTTVPEPSTIVLAALGLLGLLGCGRRRRR